MSPRPAGPGAPLQDGSGEFIEFITTGSGLPSTVFAHGVDGSIATTRPFGSGVIGSRTFLHFRGYGASAPSRGPWTDATLEEDLRAVADHVGATQAFGVSMGAGALCSLVAHTPLRFERLVFALPAVMDRPRTDPAPPLAPLGAVTASTLVIAQEQDPDHPVWVAEQLAASMPNARLKVLPPGGILLRHRDVMRVLIAGFLSGEGEALSTSTSHPARPTESERAESG